MNHFQHISIARFQTQDWLPLDPILESIAKTLMSSRDATSYGKIASLGVENTLARTGEDPENARTVLIKSESASRLSLQQSTQLRTARAAPVESSGSACSSSFSLSGAGILRIPFFSDKEAPSFSWLELPTLSSLCPKTLRGCAMAMRADSWRSDASFLRFACTTATTSPCT